MFLLSSTDRGTDSAGSRLVLPNMCVCGIGKGTGIHEARANTLRVSCDSEITSTISLKNCQAVVAEHGSVGSSNAQQTLQRLLCVASSI